MVQHLSETKACQACMVWCALLVCVCVWGGEGGDAAAADNARQERALCVEASWSVRWAAVSGAAVTMARVILIAADACCLQSGGQWWKHDRSHRGYQR